MKKLICLVIFGLLGIIGADYAAAQSNKMEKMLMKDAKARAKELVKEGWKVDGSMSLEMALYNHLKKLQAEGSEEYVGIVEGNTEVKTVNQGQQWAASMVVVSYAKQAGQTMRGRLTQEVGAALEGGPAADSFYEAYESTVEKEIKGELKKSYSIYRVKENGGIDYRGYYILNEENAHKARLRAMQMVMEESEFARKNAENISEFVRGGNF